MAGRVAETVAVAALATIMTAAIAAPVLRAPSERLFGMELIGRHHDPFTMMVQFGRPIGAGTYVQPVTDIPGALLARVSGPVAAYNWLVLLSFPLSAVAAFLLARHLRLSLAGATLAAMAYAFSPFHVAHAAYHPHIAQIQWLPLYLLALWRCLDHASPLAIAALGAAALAVTLSNFYTGLIAMVMTPVAVASYWSLTRRSDPRSPRGLAVTVVSLAVIAAAGLAYASHTAGAVMANREAFAFPRADLFRYSAMWWSYLVPPVEHPMLGAAVRRVWHTANVGDGLLEQQVSLGWGVVALALVAVHRWLARDPSSAAFARVPVLVIVAAGALVFSLSPERTVGRFTVVGPSALLYDLLPMFRAYARFGVVVQLMAAVLAGLGAEFLYRTGTRRARCVCLALVALAAFEYAVSPSTLWRDVLPTTAHRWVMRQHGSIKALDCTAPDQESVSVQWLTGHRATLLGGPITDCGEPDLSRKLAANGYTHLLVRRRAASRPPFIAPQAPDGMRPAARFDDGVVFAVTAPVPDIHTAGMTGFFPREHDGLHSWRWMAGDATWKVVNGSPRPLAVALAIEMAAFHRPRRLEVRVAGQSGQTLVVDASRRLHRVPLTIPPGEHLLVFHPEEPPTVAAEVIGNGDDRRLSFALGTWRWTVLGEAP